MVQTVGEVASAFCAWLGERLSAGPCPGLADVRVDLLPPHASPPEAGIGVLLLKVEPSASLRRPDRSAVEMSLLVLVRHPDGKTAADWAGELAFVLADEDGGAERPFQVTPGEAADTLRRELGLPPCCAMLLRVPALRQRERRPARPVLVRPVVELQALGALDGFVLGEAAGQAAHPLADASVTATEVGRETRTDGRGRFRLTGLPAQGPVALTVTAKGRSRALTVEARNDVVVRIPMA